MRPIEQLLAVTDCFLAAPGNEGLKQSTLSWRIFSDTRRLHGLRAGRDLTTQNWSDAMQWLSDHWPDGAAWPDGVPRPSRSNESTGAAA